MQIKVLSYSLSHLKALLLPLSYLRLYHLLLMHMGLSFIALQQRCIRHRKCTYVPVKEIYETPVFFWLRLSDRHRCSSSTECLQENQNRKVLYIEHLCTLAITQNLTKPQKQVLTLPHAPPPSLQSKRPTSSQQLFFLCSHPCLFASDNYASRNAQKHKLKNILDTTPLQSFPIMSKLSSGCLFAKHSLKKMHFGIKYTFQIICCGLQRTQPALCHISEENNWRTEKNGGKNAVQCENVLLNNTKHFFLEKCDTSA